MSNRFISCEFDIAAGDFGAHASAAAWYDTVYQASTDNTSIATNNAAAPIARQFTSAVRSLEGQHAELDDAFAYGNFMLAEVPVSVRVGRQTLLGGESRFFDANSIAAAMAPADYLKTMTDQSGYSGNMFLPVNQLNLTLHPLPWLSVSLYDQFEWRASRQPGNGSFLSYLDYVGAGAGRLFLTPDQYLVRDPDHETAGGQYGTRCKHPRRRGSGIRRLALPRQDPSLEILSDPLRPSDRRSRQVPSGYPSGVNLTASVSVPNWAIPRSPASFQHVRICRLSVMIRLCTSRPDRRYMMAAGRYPAHADFIVTALAETPLGSADAVAEIATDHVLGLTGINPREPFYSDSPKRARFEPYISKSYLPDMMGLPSWAISAHSFTSMPRTAIAAIFASVFQVTFSMESQ